MGDQVYKLGGELTIPVEPSGDALAAGWMPGTWVTYTSGLPTFNKSALAKVVISDGTGILAGFLLTGPQHKQIVELESDMWTTDKRQRANGDTHADLGPNDAGLAWQFDENVQLQKMGSRLVSMCIPNEGIFKCYVFETENKAKRANPSAGADLTYTPGGKLYVSENGLLTSEKETVSHTWTGYVVVRYDTDYEGTYIIFAEAQG